MDVAWLVFPQSKHLLIAMLALASALPLFAQALLHVFNLPTLVMLLVRTLSTPFLVLYPPR
jgi:hypothetical protein